MTTHMERVTIMMETSIARMLAAVGDMVEAESRAMVKRIEEISSLELEDIERRAQTHRPSVSGVCMEENQDGTFQKTDR